MESQSVNFLFWTNNPNLDKFLQSQKGQIKFLPLEKHKHGDYVCVFIDYSQNIDNLTSVILKIYLAAQENRQKVAIVAILELNDNGEKINLLKKFLDEIDSESKVHRLIVCQDLYTLWNLSPVTPLDVAIQRTIESQKAEITLKGNYFYFPLSFQNLGKGLQKVLFLTNTVGKTFYLQGIQISDLNLSYLLKSLCDEVLKTNLEIDNINPSLTEKINYHQPALKTLAELNLFIEDSFSEDLNTYIHNFEEKTVKQVENHKNFFHKFFPEKKLKNPLSLKKEMLGKLSTSLEKILATVGFVYLAISLLFISSSYFSLKYLEKTVFYLKKGDLSQSVEFLDKFSLLAKISDSNYKLISPAISFFSKDYDKVNHNFLSFLNFSQSTIQNLNQTYSLVENLYSSLNTENNNIDYQNTLIGIKTNLLQSYEYINQLEILLDKEELPKPLLQAVKQNLQFQNLKIAKDQIGEVEKMIDLFPEFLGQDSAKNIFFLLQNNNQLRSTGGTIDYIYTLTVDKGRVVTHKLLSSQEVDKLDSFILTPPPLIEKLTGEPVWHLRDMNYNPDFPQTATNIAWYLEKKLKNTPHLIISLNYSFFEKILEKDILLKGKLPNIKYADYKSKLLSGEDSALTKELVTVFFEQVLSHQVSLPDLIDIFSNTFANREANIWSNDISLEKQILTENFSGSVRSYECHPAMSTSRLCIPQTFHYNASNYSNIALNSYLKKEISHIVTPNALSLEHEVQVKYIYQHNTPLINRNLNEVIQLYLPKNAVLSSISLNNQDLPLSGVFAQDDPTLSRYQLVLSTVLNQEQLFIVKYTTPFSEKLMLPIAFTFTDLQQSGAVLGTNLEISIPDQSRPSAITSEIKQLPDKISFSFTSKIFTFGVNFVAKTY